MIISRYVKNLARGHNKVEKHHPEGKNVQHTLQSKRNGNNVCVCVCVCVFIKLHITTQSGPVILVILCHSH